MHRVFKTHTLPSGAAWIHEIKHASSRRPRIEGQTVSIETIAYCLAVGALYRTVPVALLVKCNGIALTDQQAMS